MRCAYASRDFGTATSPTAFDYTPPPPDNVLRVECTLDADLSEFAAWPEATARAFFVGLALVISAQQIGKPRCGPPNE